MEPMDEVPLKELGESELERYRHRYRYRSVSYTHLTLPTIYSV